MSRDISSAFFEKLQGESIQMVELLELTSHSGRNWKWAASNETVVSSLANWDPFPGMPATGIEESLDLGISIIDFVIANSSDTFNDILKGQDLDAAALTVRRVFVDTPDLGAMSIFIGQLGEFSHTRNQMTGRVRDSLGGRSREWPYHTYMDQCAWRFGSPGCAFDTALETISGTIIASTSGELFMQVTSGTLPVSSHGINRFEFGKFTFTSGANSGSVRAVFASSGDHLTMSHRMALGVVSGDTFSIFPGCKKRLIEDCLSLYNNTSNYLGFPWIPRQEDAF